MRLSSGRPGQMIVLPKLYVKVRFRCVAVTPGCRANGSNGSVAATQSARAKPSVGVDHPFCEKCA